MTRRRLALERKTDPLNVLAEESICQRRFYMYYSRWWNISAVGLALRLAAAPGYAQHSAAPTSPTEEKAMATLMKAAEFLAKAQRFSVTADIGYDIEQDWGQKLEFGATRKITVRRPDRLARPYAGMADFPGRPLIHSPSTLTPGSSSTSRTISRSRSEERRVGKG